MGQHREHRLELARRPGQQHDDPVSGFQPQPRRRATCVVDHDRPVRNRSLTPVALRHRPPPGGEPSPQVLDDRWVLCQGQTEHVGHRLAGEIVVGRPQATADNEQVGPVEGLSHSRPEVGRVITDNRLAAHHDTQLVQPGGQEQRVRIGPERREQLGADRNDLCRRQPAPGPRRGPGHAATPSHRTKRSIPWA